MDLLPWLCCSQRKWTGDRMASTADITPDLQLGRVEVLRGLMNLLLHMDKPEHHNITCLKERGVRKEVPDVPSSGI